MSQDGSKQDLTNSCIHLLQSVIPSSVGILFFLCPVSYGGVRKILVAHCAQALHDHGGAVWPSVITCLLVVSAVLTCWATWWRPKCLQPYPWLGEVGVVSPVWLCIRCLGALLAVLALWNVGETTLPAQLYDRQAGILFSMLPVLLTNLLVGLLVAPLLMQFGLLEFIGVFMNGIMRPLFRLPGRAAVDCLASWVGDGTIGAMMSLREYEKGGYTAQEASTVITCFSAPSITFCVFLLGEVGLMHHFGAFYLTIVVSSLVAAIVMPRIPPLSRKPMVYVDGRSPQQDRAQGTDAPQRLWHKGVSAAVAKARTQTSPIAYLQNVAISWVGLIVGTLPSVMTIATLGLWAANSPYVQPVLACLGKPFVPLLAWAGVPHATHVADTLFIGFVDMCIPPTMIKALAGEAYAMTRFVVTTMAVAQVIYLSEQGPVLLGSSLKFSLRELALIFVLRTVILLPVIVGCAKLFFGA